MEKEEKVENIVEKLGENSYNKRNERISEEVPGENGGGALGMAAGAYRRKSHLATVLEVAGHKARYDAEVKKILSDRTILAWILKYTVSEFENFTIEEIRASIEGEPEVSAVPVYPGRKPSEAVTGSAVEDAVPNEGKITYDIRFYVITPGGKRVKLYINVEAQKKYYAGYDLVTRAVFYCARMLSAQMDTEFGGKDYDEVKKVYSIWICLDTPSYAANTITEYHIAERKKYGDFKGRARYDLLSAVMVCLGKEAAGSRKQKKQQQAGTKLHALLATLLSERMSPEEKTKLLADDFDIAATVEMKEEMRIMCNLSDLIEERGIEQGLGQGIKALLEAYKEFGLTREEAMTKVEEKLPLSPEAAEAYMSLYWDS